MYIRGIKRSIGFMVFSLLLLGACQEAVIIDSGFSEGNASAMGFGKEDRIRIDHLPPGFPSAQDLAVIYPLATEVGIRGDLMTDNGRFLLPPVWVDNVSDAYADTDVGNALETENVYEDWRVVALRFVPCGPLGIRPDQDIQRLCWPQVRLVWQPVVKNVRVNNVVREFYADDRAIHALYHVSPEGTASEPLLQEMRQFLGQGGNPNTLDREFVKAFIARRNIAITRLIKGVADLRASGSLMSSMEDINIRAELNTDDIFVSDGFQQRLSDLLGALCEPENLFELTSFSLPEGRAPALLNLWVFVAFNGSQGQLVQKPIQVIGRDSGFVIGHAGMDEAVGMTITPDPELLEGLDDPQFAEELEASVPFERADLDRLDAVINDPNKTLVPNTVCSGCHSYNPIRFDFHALSHMEHREATVAPRVNADVANDLLWLRQALGQ